MWEPYKKGFKAWLQLEKSLSDNSVDAYLADIDKLTQYLLSINQPKAPNEIQLTDLQQFLYRLVELGMTAGSQSRIISGIRSFYKYCIIENISTTNPTELLEMPKLNAACPKHFPSPK